MSPEVQNGDKNNRHGNNEQKTNEEERAIMQDLTIYQGEATMIVPSSDPAQVDARFLAMWLHGKSEKTIRAYTAALHRLYQHTDKSLQQLTLEGFQHFINSLIHLKPRSRAH